MQPPPHPAPGFAVVSRLQNNELIFSYTFYYSQRPYLPKTPCNMLVRLRWMQKKNMAKKVLEKKECFSADSLTNAKAVVVR